MNERLRSLPSVDEVLARPAVRALAERVGRAAAKAAVRAAIAESRARLQGGDDLDDEPVPDARVLELTRADFDALLNRYPLLAYEMLRVLSMRLRESHDAAIRDLHEKNARLAQAYADLVPGRVGLDASVLLEDHAELRSREPNALVFHRDARATVFAVHGDVHGRSRRRERSN